MKPEIRELLTELMEQGCDEQLKEIRDGYLKWVPKELIHIEDREIVDTIDEYFELNKPFDLFESLGCLRT